MVTSPSVSDSGPVAGATFTLSATVRNDGEGDAVATTLRYYRSADATITTSDTEVGMDAVAELAASGSSSQSVELTAPATPGMYWYGACVDAVTDETDTTNNCSTSVQVTVPEPDRHPDLVVTSPTVSDSGPAAGAEFTLSATVRNAGEGDAAATTLRYYQSTDTTITALDTEVGMDAVAELAASGSSSQSVELTAPATPGMYWYGACVDAVTDETDTTNNCSASVQVTVPETEPEPDRHPDLVVTPPSVSDSGPAAGATFTLSATVRNAGEGDAAATTLRYYLSTDTTITALDTEVGMDAVAELAAARSSGQSVKLTAPSSPGTYYYGACVEAVTDETDTTNNCSASVQVTVPEPEPEPEPDRHPDLMVTSPTVSDSGPAAGAEFTLSATVRNAGEGDAAATTLRYYQSADTTITALDTEVGMDAVAELAAAGSSDRSVELTAPSSPGTYYYGACVEAVTDESDATNNCSASVQVTVPEPEPEPEPERHPDLMVTSPTVSDSGPAAGAEFTLSATVRNAGEGDAAATTLRYYQSTDTTITASDTEVGMDAVAELAASGSSSQSVELTAPATPGMYWYGACVDAVTDETDTTNNCSASVPVTVPEPKRPDLVVTLPRVNDSGPAADAEFTLSATVRNDGEGAAAATTLRYYQSTDATITAADAEVGREAVTGLGVAGSVGASVKLRAPAEPGTYYYGACVDAVAGDSDTSNNCSMGVRVTVAEPERPPDLVVVSPSVSDRRPNAGAEFTLWATVRNRGEGPSPPTTLRYYRSSDATITTSDTVMGMDEVGPLSASQTSANSISLTAPSPPIVIAYHYGACVGTVTGESDTTNNCSPAVPIVPILPSRRPDLVARSPSISKTELDTGEEFTLSATVHNQGDGDAAATTLRYYLARRFFTTYVDHEVGAVAVAELVPAGSSEESLTTTAPTDPRADHFYRACVDAPLHETDKRNNCTAWVRYYLSNPRGRPNLAPSMRGAQSADGIAPGHPVPFFATVGNYGDRKSAATALHWYLTTDAELDSEETGSPVFTPENKIRTDAIGELYPRATKSWSPPPAPAETGHYQYGLCVDPVPGETERLDNCLSEFEMEFEVR